MDLLSHWSVQDYDERTAHEEIRETTKVFEFASALRLAAVHATRRDATRRVRCTRVVCCSEPPRHCPSGCT